MPDIYMESASIGEKVKLSTEKALVTVNEKNSLGKLVTYTVDELEIMQETGIDEVTPLIHIVKKVFAGTVVRYTKPEK